MACAACGGGAACSAAGAVVGAGAGVPKDSINARDAACAQMDAESAATMADDMAARWWGKKDLGDAREEP